MKKAYLLTLAMAFGLAGCSQSSTQAEDYVQQQAPGPSENAEQTQVPESGTVSAQQDTTITCNGKNIEINGGGAFWNQTLLSITQPGTYTLKGSLDGAVAVNAKGKVTLVLDNISIQSDGISAIAVEQADQVTVRLAEGSQNSLTAAEPAADQETDAVLFSKDDLVIEGNGTLAVTGEASGIHGKDSAEIHDARLTIDCLNHGISGKDEILVDNAVLHITTKEGDGLHSSNEEKGTITLNSSTLEMTTADDGIDAEGLITIDRCSITLTAGGGSSAVSHTQGFAFGNRDQTSSESSAKGIKSAGDIELHAATLDLDTADDALHADGSISFFGGIYDIKTGDDAVHADGTITVSDGTIRIAESLEGMEASSIIIDGGDLTVHSYDDGINTTDGSGSTDMFRADTSSLTVNGGTVTVYADGDGIDVNGNAVINGGTIVVYGPENSANAAVDFNGTFTIAGGTLLAGGAAGMLEIPQNSADQALLVVGMTGSCIIQDEAGNTLLRYETEKNCQALIASAPSLKAGQAVTLIVDGENIGTFTLTEGVNMLNDEGMMNGSFGPPGSHGMPGEGFEGRPGGNGSPMNPGEGSEGMPGPNGEMPQPPQGGMVGPGHHGRR